MKLINSSSFILVLVFCFVTGSYPQSAFYDAMELTRYVNPKTGLFTTNADSIEEYASILSKASYLKVDPKPPNAIAVLNHFERPESPNFNPFIADFIELGGVSFDITPVLKDITGRGISTVGGLNVTTVADGLAKFLVKRTKEELNQAFFDNFKDVFKNYPELTKLFPTTSRFVEHIETSNYTAMLQTLKDAFEMDLRNLAGNVRNLRNLHENDCYDSKHKDNCIERITKIKEVFLKEEGMVLVATSILVQELINGVNIADALTEITRDPSIEVDSTNFSNIIKTINLFSESLRDTSESIWVSVDEIEKLVNNKNTRDIFLGLIYQRSRNLGLKFSYKVNQDSTVNIHLTKILETLKTNEAQAGNYLTEVVTSAQNIDVLIKEIKGIKQQSQETKLELYYRYYLASFDLVSGVSEIIKFIPENSDNIIEAKIDTLKSKIDRHVSTVRTSGEIYYNIKSRNFGSAILNTTYLLENTILDENNSVVYTKLLKYGTFISNVAQAEDSDQVAAAIESAVLPAGSSAIKRKSVFNVSLNAYVGFFGGVESAQMVDPGIFDNSNVVLGFSSPVGAAASWGICNGWSFSLYATIIDIGGITAYRFDDNSTEGLPEIELKNIISPGGYFVFGIPGSPLSFGGGIQVGPELRKITMPDPSNSQMTIIEQVNAVRLSLFFAVDIPLLNFYTKPK